MSQATSPARRRVVVTGVGCATPLGLGVERTWQAAIEGRSGVRAITRFDASEFPVCFAGEVRDELDLSALPSKEARRLDRAIALALVAADEAIAQAGLTLDDANRDRVGVAIGSGIGGIETLQKGAETLIEFGPRRVHPFMIPMAICNMASGYVAIRYGMQGPNLCHVSACASGAHSIGEAARIVERGDADVMVAGGCEAPITSVGVAGFAAMRALSTRNDDFEAASRPFDRDRDGFVMGEGAGVLVLEGEEHARARGAVPLGVLLGYAATCDAAHVAQPTVNAEGAQRCMRLALADAGLAPEDVDHINAHATSTPMGDVSEVRAIRAVFGAHADRVAVSATKSMTGHLLGAAGAVEAILTLRALATGTLPPTINLDAPDPECELDHVANKARSQGIRVGLSNSFGFGGTNATLILGAAG
ncbi:MAG: beta-ketoacyl-ACP synthase II [Myxococcales bacterium]|nr:beta-ketoacyl-ACP synthase II [Myxococcales bacterium]